MTSIANLQIKVDSAEVESATKRLKELTTATSDVAKAEEKVRRPRKGDEQDTARLLGQIDRQTKSLDKLAAQQRMLNAAHAEGKISGDVLEKYNKILAANIELVKSRGTVADESSAKSKAAAEREAKREQERQQKADLRAQRQAEAETRREAARQSREAKQAALATAREEKQAAQTIAAQEKQAAKVAAAEQKAQARSQALQDKAEARSKLLQEREAARAVAQQEKAAARAVAQQAKLDAQNERAAARTVAQQERLEAQKQKAAAKTAAQQERESARILAQQEKAAAKAAAALERQAIKTAALQEREAARTLAAQERAEVQATKLREREAARTLAAEQRAQKQSLAAAERAAKEKAAAENKVAKESAREQEQLDKLRYASTLRRYQAEIDAADKAEKAEKKRQQELKNLTASLDPYAREMIRISELEQKLFKHKDSFSAEQITQYKNRLAEARKEAERYKGTLDKTGLSAKQLRMAQQGLPAQFTDIVVSLQGGQAPLTVLLQQGGQMKDMFGGIGPMLRGVGSAIAGLIGPWTIMGAVIATTVGLWYSGAGEMAKLNKAIILGGNAAGTTAGQLRLMAEANSDGIASVRDNSEALALLVQNGKLLPETYQAVASAAANMATASGIAVSDLVDDFTSLGKEPVAAAVKLNEKYGFLTISTYKQAQALEEQGRQQEAIKLLTNELATVMEDRAKKMKESARGVAAAWNAVKKAVSDSIDAAGAKLNPTLEMDLANKNQDISYFGRFMTQEQREASPAYQKLLEERQEIVNQIYEQREAAYKEGEATRQTRIQIELENAARSKQVSMLTAVQKAKRDLAQFDERAKEAPDMNPADTKRMRKVWEDALTKAEKEAKEKLDAKDPKSAILDNTDANEIGNKINEIKAQYKALGETITQQQNAGTLSSEAAVAKRKQLLEEEASKVKSTYEQQIAALEKLKSAKNISKNQTISLDRQIADARSKMVIAEEDAGRKLDKLAGDEETRLRKQREAVDAYSQSLDRMLENLRVAGERERAGLSMSSGERDLNNKLNSEDDRYNNEVISLNQQKLENPDKANVYDEELKAAADNHTAMKKQIVNNYEQMKVAQQDWAAGVSSAYKQYAEDGQNYAAMTNEVFTNAFNGMEDALVSFVTTGKASFSDLTKSILTDMARMAVRIATSRALTAILGMWASPAAPAAASMGSATSYDMGMVAAKGAAFDNGTQYFAKGGAFTNSIVSKPTSFSTNQSNNNVMGEAGPEAIMPLTRASDGSLGVRASVDVSGLQQNAGGGVQVYITIDGQGNKQTSTSSPDYSSFGSQVGEFVDQRYKQLISKDLQPGGDIWKSMQG